jgi:3-hydroxyacyl-CoA dehydrogenase/enoyl-CoA hydratase/3-hydroxybutyryl-CoA epimerase
MNDTAAVAFTLTWDPDGIAWLVLDRPGTSTNSLSRAVMEELDRHVTALAGSPPRGLVVKSGKANGFIAGADIREFEALDSEDAGFRLVRAGQLVLDRLEALPCPTVAAIHGFALGGGLELALACRYRVAVDDPKTTLGLPEVQLGIHPGFGGTVRAVALLGTPVAMELMLTGKPMRAEKALRVGLVDRLAPPGGLDEAARAILDAAPPPRRPPLGTRALTWPIVRSFVRPRLDAQVAAKARREHYPAPYAIVDLWAGHGGRGPAAYEAEARSIARLFQTETSRNLVRVFHLQDRLKALAGRAPRRFARVHVVGAGVMGGDIAAWCAQRGLEVTLEDRELRFVEPALARAREAFAKHLRRTGEAEAAMARLRPDVDGSGVPEADVVIEAIYENLEAKRALHARLLPRMRPDALLATNTSSIRLEALAEGLPEPARLVGLHFFNPVAQMPLVEVVRSGVVRTDVVEDALAFTRRIDKLPLPCRSAPGFVVNRVLAPYLEEAMRAAEDGVPLAVIDEAAVAFGMPMGPIELADVVGLDVVAHVGEIVAGELGRTPPRLPRLEALLAAKRFGRKSGQGYYAWRDGTAVKSALEGTAPAADLGDRLILSLINECVAVLREGLVEDADLLDAGVIFGTGFAPFRGGPIAHARRQGPAQLMERLERLADTHGDRFRPDEGWRALGESHKA